MQQIEIREATNNDYNFIVELMHASLDRYYGGDHTKHAERIFNTHISGGKDNLGFFSTIQKMFIATYNDEKVGMLHLVGKRQKTMKISPLIVHEKYRNGRGIGKALLKKAENFAINNGYNQIYCTVAKQNNNALNFFKKNKYIVAGHSDSHYKSDITELMLYKILAGEEYEVCFDREHISVLPFSEEYADQVRSLLLTKLPNTFLGIDDEWVSSLFEGYRRRKTGDVNSKYKLIYLARDRQERVRGVVGATPKKGSPIKLMPFIATDNPSFVALLKDTPYFLREFGHKLYMHITPSPEEVVALQQNGWQLNAALPAAYHPDTVTQQWSLDIDKVSTMRSLRVKDRFLKEIEAGKKDLEVRVAYDSIRNISPGENIEFSSRTRTVLACVKNIRRYNSFEELLDKEIAERIVPGESKQSLLAILKDIYPPDKERLGPIVLEIAPINR